MKILTLVVVALISVSSFAQSISGKAYYQSKTTVDMDGFGGREMSEDMKKQIMERMKTMLEKTYILTFNNNESIYKEEEKLEAGAQGGVMRMMMGSFTPGIQYKNLSDNKILEEREFFGKEFLINDTIANLQWEVGKESKQIGQYIAIKATAVKHIDKNDFNFARRKRDEDKKPEDGEVKDGKESKDSTDTAAMSEDPMDMIEVPKTLIVTAWFTPQIPVKSGPGEYAGLPGLILELNIDRTTMLCSKIVLNPNESDKIEKPTTGKEVSREEYNQIVKEKTEEMRENFRGSGGRRGNMRFGGR